MTTQASYDYDIFLSHNRADEPWVWKLAESLEKEEWQGRKLRVFFSPWDIRPGQSIPKRMEEALPKSRKVGLVMSPGAMESAWVEVERLVTTYIDISERQERLIPLYRHKCDIPALLKPILYIDFRDDSKFEESYQKLLAVIKDEPLPRGERTKKDEPVPMPPDIPRPPIVGFVARRDREGRDIVERLREELAPRKDQLVVLWGAGGVGKTTLAAEAARALAEDFAGRVVWVSADARTDLPFTTLLDEIARQLGGEDLRRLAPDQKAEAVAQLIAAAPTLIVLDNFETISEAEEELCKEFLSRRVRSSVLITSRQRIDNLRAVPIDAMSPDEADKFLRRLIEQSPDRDIYAELDLGRIIETAEANPLIIEWIVGQIDLANDPEEVLNDLAHGEGDAAHRVFDRSFNLPQLNNGGRAVLLALSFFVPSTSRSALAAVAHFDLGKKKDKERFRKAYETLASLWLIKKAEAGQRLAVAGLTRELTKARLAHDPRGTIYRQRFITRFLEYAISNSEPAAEHLNNAEKEKGNILNAMYEALAAGEWRSAINIRAAMSEFLYIRGYWDEAIQSGERALEVARNLLDERVISAFTYNIAFVLQQRGDIFKARQLYNESLDIDRKLDYKKGIAITLHQLAWLASDEGDMDVARQFYKESLELRKRVDDQVGIAWTLNNLAGIACHEGELEEALRLMDESLEIRKRINDQSGIAASLLNFGMFAQRQGELEKARKLFDESLEIVERLGDQQGIADSLLYLGAVAQDRGDLEEARRLYSESLKIKKSLGDQLGISSNLHQLGTIDIAEGRFDEAENNYNQSLAALRKLGHKQRVAICLESIGNLRVSLNNYSEAHPLFEEALSLAGAVGDKLRIASIKRSRGLLAEKENEKERAAELLGEALRSFEELKSPQAEETRRDLERLEDGSSSANG